MLKVALLPRAAPMHAHMPLITTLAAALGLALILGFIAARLKPAGAGRLPARRRADRAGHAGLRRRRRPRRPARRDRRDAADVRRRPALLARRPARGAPDRGARRARADGVSPRRWARRSRCWLGLDARRRRWCSGSRCRWRAPSCCCARSRARGVLDIDERPHRRRLAGRRGPGDGAGAGAAAAAGRRARRGRRDAARAARAACGVDARHDAARRSPPSSR